MDYISLHQLFGEGKDLNVLQMCSRAFVVFFIALLLVRISGRRTFGKRTAFDNTLAIILGAVLSRAIVGASPFVPTIVASSLLVVIHRGLGLISINNNTISKLLKGTQITLFEDGLINKHNLNRSLLSEKDLMADVRAKAGTNNLSEIDQIYMETNGEVTVIKKDKSTTSPGSADPSVSAVPGGLRKAGNS
ncbi:DUF421 domain-containing protein [Mucilaginibacter sp. RS28]|uniref:DUF421 domain-containing protein n=1 Tax=Mucilaginibacter straminoryzae TaxID=2932774 RepID=A0A9X1X590_9SPHI|nr:YetF domain-containing protein [Mucilaginibacter straminoryzae]MCJ8211284.1 DUF421 domain-containing protein [Mucilaginibacter straminoryzae]